MASTDLMQFAHQTTKAPRPPDNDEYADAEKNYQPKSPNFWMVIISMYMAIILVALDRMIIAIY